ncbi:MAG: DNA polymerase III subunit delta' [Acidaminococcales bacterium]|nr:DNA polymerase III subunit delta' [Acidaminococcales bacterium]
MLWEDIIGHNEEKFFLQKLSKAKRKPHAFLLVGPAGVGKILLAQAFAATLMCGGREAPCGVCPSCRHLEKGSHPDYFVLRPELKDPQKDPLEFRDGIYINQVRGLLREAAFAPKMGKKRVAVIDGAHLMTPEAANSLLKFLEEPPPEWVFVLLSTSAEALLPTIVSRTARINARPLTTEEILLYLKEKSVKLPNPNVAAGVAAGSPGLALRYGGEEADKNRERALDFIGAALADDYLRIAPLVEKIKKEEAVLLCEFVALFLRDAWRVNFTGGAGVWNTDKREEIGRLFSGFDLSVFKAFLRYTEETLAALKKSANPQLLMEGLYIYIADKRQGGFCGYGSRSAL